jgi:energy-converting hydrogenase Eha subunit B
MSGQIVVHKGRTNSISVGLGYDVSGDVFTSQIRADSDTSSALLATWVVTFATDGSDGELVLSIDDSITREITADRGYMDIKRVSNGEPLAVFDKPVEVIFQGSVTD